MDSGSVALLRELLAETGWLERARELGLALRATRSPGGLLLVGTPDDEPWHLTAHLADEARFSGLSQLTPTLLRWAPPPDAPPHLRVGLDRLEQAGRGETLFVLAEQQAPVPLLERVDDARRTGGDDPGDRGRRPRAGRAGPRRDRGAARRAGDVRRGSAPGERGGRRGRPAPWAARTPRPPPRQSQRPPRLTD
ncbi:hypothetical protein GCM10020001_079450 [Nonomuraea salmonea]